MLNRLQAASRLLIRASLALFTAVVLLLIQSAFWTDRVSAWMEAIIFATALVSYFRPHYGLLAVAVLAPLGTIGSRALGSDMRGAEGLVLAFLAGALARGWTLGEFRTFPSSRLHIAATIFGLVVAASCVEQIWFMQIQRDFAWPFALDILIFASRDYLTSFRGYGVVFRAMLLVEGLALSLYTVRYVREQPGFGDRLVVTLVASATATALLTLGYVASELVETGQARARFVEFATVHRWTVHVGDVNAAGSFFAMGTFMALGMALGRNRYRAAWMAAAFVLAGTTWLTHSRTALVAVALMLACVATTMTIGRIIGIGKTIAITVGAFAVLAVAMWHYLGAEYFGAGAQAAVRIRWLFLGVTWRMLLAEPVFGVGVGQYFLWSHQFSVPEILAYYQRENAHNNFAQIAGELGIAGLVSFVAVLGVSLWHRHREPQSSLFRLPVLLGLAAFMMTWLGGHPLLVAEAAYPFWIALGLAAALVASDSRGELPVALVGLAVVLLLVSIPIRVAAKASHLDLSRISYGLTTRQVMTSRARFFVPAGHSLVEFPLRARGASDEKPVEIDVFIDGRASNGITLSDRSWRRSLIELSGHSSGRFRQIDLRIRPGAVNTIDAVRPSVEVGNWEIISKPNG